MYKNLYSYPFLETAYQGKPYYKLEELYDYVTSEGYEKHVINHLDRNLYTSLNEHVRDNLIFLRETGLPSHKQEQFNFSNLNKLFNRDILNTNELAVSYLDRIEKFDYLVDPDILNEIILCDSNVLASETLSKRRPYNLQILDISKINKNRHLEYVKLLDNTDNFSNLTYGLSRFPNVIVFPNGSKERYYKNPIKIKYANSSDEPILECNTTIIDVQYDTSVKIKESIQTRAGQMNYTTYIVRENSTLEIERHSNDFGGWNLFDSRFICHPGSTVKIKFKNTGSSYTQENFYFKISSDVNVELIGRNNIFKGNEYHQFVRVRSVDHDNRSIVDIKNVGDEHARTSFVGKYEINSTSIGFDGQMDNRNLMLSPTANMHTRPILDIYTKEIECTHGCTISNVDKDQLYYLQSKGFDKHSAKSLLIDSFLC